MKNFIIGFLLITNNILLSQFTIIDHYSIQQSPSSWNVDALGYLYVIYDNDIVKYDTSKEILFTQSIKSLGEIENIEFINAQKLLLFSKQQQQLYLLDNTLSSNGVIVDLDDFQFNLITHVSSSSRPNLLWLFDQFNSSITLLDLNKRSIVQSVTNFKGLNLIKDDIIFFKEIDNHLYIGTIKETFILDMNLNQIETIPLSINDKSVKLGLTITEFDDQGCSIFNLINYSKKRVDFPIERLKKIITSNNILFAETSGKIFRLKVE